MAEMGCGYGSECHLLRYLGRHRAAFDAAVCAEIGCEEVRWLDYPFDRTRSWKDGEWKGLDFMPEDSPARDAWRRAWPQRGNAPNWDAVGQVVTAAGPEWLLVEAKAHTGELKSSCGAGAEASKLLIQSTLDATKGHLGVAAQCDWMNGYYQFCNRVAILNLLQEAGAPAHLLFVYFTGDAFRNGANDCPQSAAGWQPALDEQARHVGLPEGHPLAGRIHKLFLPVCP